MVNTEWYTQARVDELMAARDRKLGRVAGILEEMEGLAEHGAFIKSDPYEITRQLREALRD